MQTFLAKNRWAVLVSTIVCQCMCNFPASWAVFQPYVADVYGYSGAAATLVMPMCVVFFGFISIIGGRVQDKVSPRIAGAIGTLFIALSFFNAWWIPAGNPLYMYLGFCLCFGGGCGFIMQAAMACLMKWYADKKGSAVGIAGAAAGLYTIASIYGAEWLLSHFGPRQTMLGVGVVALVLCSLVTVTLVAPTKEFLQEKDALSKAKVVGKNKPAMKTVDFTPAEMLRTPQYYFYCLSSMFMVPSFQLINPQLVSLCMQKGLSKELALSATAIGAAATAIGRFIIPMLSDKLGRKNTMAAMWAASLVLAFLLMGATGVSILGVFSVFSFCYSGGFAIIASFTNDMFGFQNAGTNSGFVNIASSIGSFAGPAILTATTPLWGANAVHWVGIIGAAVGLVCMLLVNPDTAATKEKQIQRLLEKHEHA